MAISDNYPYNNSNLQPPQQPMSMGNNPNFQQPQQPMSVGNNPYSGPFTGTPFEPSEIIPDNSGRGVWVRNPNGNWYFVPYTNYHPTWGWLWGTHVYNNWFNRLFGRLFGRPWRRSWRHGLY
jgi:hypothetical protein